MTELDKHLQNERDRVEILQLAILIFNAETASKDDLVTQTIPRTWNTANAAIQKVYLDIATEINKTHVLWERPKVCPYPMGSNCPYL